MEKFITFIGIFNIMQIKEITERIIDKNDWTNKEELQINTMIGNYLISVVKISNKNFVHITIELINNDY